MAIFRQYIAPLIVVLIFLVSLLAVSARIFLPEDMAAPAPIEEVSPAAQGAPTHPAPSIPEQVAGLPAALNVLVQGLPE